jgi:hypothetical protein
MGRGGVRELLGSRFVLFSCEGAAEGVVMQRLYDEDVLAVPSERVVVDPMMFTPYTRLRKAGDISQRFLGTSYEGYGASGLLIARIVDSRAGKFVLPRRWSRDVAIESFFTRPEIEMLVIHAEDAYGVWQKACRRDRQLRPSEFCKGQLGLDRVKETVFLRDYWDTHNLVGAIKSYDEHRGRKDGELSLGDLIA